MDRRLVDVDAGGSAEEPGSDVSQLGVVGIAVRVDSVFYRVAIVGYDRGSMSGSGVISRRR